MMISRIAKRASRRCCRHISSSVISSQHSSSSAGNGAGDVCLLGERYKYPSCLPSEEHAAFAFARLASPGHTTINREQFLDVLKRMKLDFNLSPANLGRVFDSLDKNGDGRLSLEEFKDGRTSSAFAKALVQTLSGAGRTAADETEKCEVGGTQFPDPNFDWTMSTAEFYRAPVDDGFVGKNVSIRKALDYDYHTNYTPCRQHFQDELIRNNVLLDGSGTERPWLVFTCGNMGAGKGWVLGWMSANGILPFERVSKIDPDAFKLRMPEWIEYQRHGMEDSAGTRTHAESSYIAEIAQRCAMRNGMNVWVDGSLRNWKWHQNDLTRIRRRHPQYRIAIVAIDAPEDMIERNIRRRAEETGRHIPEELRRASSQGIEQGLRELTHLVDLVAHVRNENVCHDEQHVAEPTLRSVSMIDRSGNWDLIRELTSFDE